jgi:asparagine synthase (glutamine-hydrolysing)
MTDPFGFIPKFVVHGSTTEYSRLIDAVHASRTVTLDFSSLNVFFRTGMFLNGGTPFKEIKRVISHPRIIPPTPIDRELALDAYIELFRSAIRKNARREFAIAISGGADSRHILFELIAQGLYPKYALTVAIPGRPSELDIARRICSRLSVPHRVVQPRAEDSVKNEMWKNVACDFMSLEHQWYSEVGQNRDSLPWYDGIAGDVLSAGLFLTADMLRLFNEEKIDQLADSLVRSKPLPLIHDQSPFPREEVVHILHSELVRHRYAANPVGSFYFWNRTRISIGSSAFGLLRQSGQETIAPYLDESLWQFLSSLPASMLLDHKFHVDAIHRAYRQYRDIEFFKVYETEPIGAKRQKAISLLRFILQRKRVDREVIGTTVRALRALILKARACDIEWILVYSLYMFQIKDIVEGKR